MCRWAEDHRCSPTSCWVRSPRIQVNPAVIANPSLVRDGTQDIAGSPAGASAFTTNPAGGTGRVPDADSTACLTSRWARTPHVIEDTATHQQHPVVLARTARSVPHYAAPATLADGATALVSAQAAVSASATSHLSSEQALQTTLNANQAAVSGVSMDTEMSQHDRARRTPMQQMLAS